MGGPPSDPLYDTKSSRAPHGIAVFARTHHARVLVQLKCNLGFESQARTFQDDFRAELVSHGFFSDNGFLPASIIDWLCLIKMLFFSRILEFLDLFYCCHNSRTR